MNLGHLQFIFKLYQSGGLTNLPVGDILGNPHIVGALPEEVRTMLGTFPPETIIHDIPVSSLVEVGAKALGVYGQPTLTTDDSEEAEPQLDGGFVRCKNPRCGAFKYYNFYPSDRLIKIICRACGHRNVISPYGGETFPA